MLTNFELNNVNESKFTKHKLSIALLGEYRFSFTGENSSIYLFYKSSLCPKNKSANELIISNLSVNMSKYMSNFSNLLNLQYFYLSDHLGSSSWITDKDGNALQHLSYLPFGEVFANQKASGSSFDAEFKFLGKELDAETGYTKTDNRYYWANAGIFLSVDPLCDERPWITPFNYAQNNPIGRKDPTGLLDDVYITGAAAGEATAQLQEATPNLKIKRDMGTGQLSYDGQAKTRAERKIARAIDDDRVTVFVEAGNSEKFSHIKGEGYTRGGSFLGNELCYDGDGNTFVETFQYVNPEMLANDFYGSTGQGMLHEISESYKGGRISLRKGITNVGLGNEFNRVYNKAHNRALPQPEWKYAPKPTQPATIQDIMEKANTFQQSQIKPFFFK